MKKVIIVLGVTILGGALVVSALAGPRWGQRGWGGGHMMGYGGGPMMGGYGGVPTMGYGGGCGYGWNQPQARQWGQGTLQDPESSQAPPRFQGQDSPYGPGFGRRFMRPGWGGNMVNPYQGVPSWGNGS